MEYFFKNNGPLKIAMPPEVTIKKSAAISRWGSNGYVSQESLPDCPIDCYLEALDMSGNIQSCPDKEAKKIAVEEESLKESQRALSWSALKETLPLKSWDDYTDTQKKLVLNQPLTDVELGIE